MKHIDLGWLSIVLTGLGGLLLLFVVGYRLVYLIPMPLELFPSIAGAGLGMIGIGLQERLKLTDKERNAKR